MLVQKLTLASAALLAAGLIAWGASAALISLGDEPPEDGDSRRRTGGLRPSPRRSQADPLDAVGTFPVRGRVLDPDGKPVAGAGVYVRPLCRTSLERERPDGRAAEGARGVD